MEMKIETKEMKMKKLMMIAAVAVAAIAANAASVTWNAAKGYLYEAGGAQKITSGDAYLMFVTASYGQSDLVSAFAAANGDVAATIAAMTASGSLATGTGTIESNARISTTTSTYAMTGDMSAYFVVFNGDKMYISGVADALYDSVSQSSDIVFAAMSTSSKGAAMNAAAGYSAAGWYAAPEPTSGLLMLVGLAGLALRRRRA